MTAPTSPSPDSLAVVVAELRSDSFRTSNLRLSSVLARWADRIERLDAEMRKELDAIRKINERVRQAQGDTIQDLRAKLSACERDAARYRFLREC